MWFLLHYYQTLAKVYKVFPSLATLRNVVAQFNCKTHTHSTLILLLLSSPLHFLELLFLGLADACLSKSAYCKIRRRTGFHHSTTKFCKPFSFSESSRSFCSSVKLFHTFENILHSLFESSFIDVAPRRQPNTFAEGIIFEGE